MNIFDNEEQVSDKLNIRFKHIRKIAKQYELLDEEMTAVLCLFEKNYLLQLITKVKTVEGKDEQVKEAIFQKLERTLFALENSNQSVFMGKLTLTRTLKELYDMAILKIDKKLLEMGK